MSRRAPARGPATGSQEATNPEAPFRGSGALTARHGPHLNPSSIAGGGKDVRTLAPRSGEAGEGQSSHHRSLAASPSPVLRSGHPLPALSAFTHVFDALWRGEGIALRTETSLKWCLSAEADSSVRVHLECQDLSRSSRPSMP